MAENRTCNVELEYYKDAFRRIPHPPGGVCTIKDPRSNHIDYDGNALRLQDCSYTMSELETKCIINRWSATNPVNFASYSTMKNVRQESIVRFENHFHVSTQSTIVLSWFDGSLAAWAREGNYIKHPLREHFFEINLYPKAITINDIFVCNDNEKGSFSVQILVMEVDRLFRKWDQEQRKKKLKNDVKIVFRKICNESSVRLSESSMGFLRYIADGNADMLEGFPDVWSFIKKACYLLSLMAADHTVVSEALKTAQFGWPNNISLILQKVLEHNKKKKKPIKYVMKDGYDYLKLCRHIVKHWKEYCEHVSYLWMPCATVEDFLRKIEQWTPNIWCDLYKAVGWPRGRRN